MTPTEFARLHLIRAPLAEQVTFAGEPLIVLNELCREVRRLSDENASLKRDIESDSELIRDMDATINALRKDCRALEVQRLMDENAQLRSVCEESELNREGIKHAHAELKRAEAELATAHETIKRLNRRVQVAEAGVAEKVKEYAGGSLGRALANAAASHAQAELAALKARIAEAASVTIEYSITGGWWINTDKRGHVPQAWSGKRVRLVVEELT